MKRAPGLYTGLTVKQADLLSYLRTREAAGAECPSFDEMRLALDLATRSGVHRLLTALEERGWIERLPHRKRAITVLAERKAFAPHTPAELERATVPELLAALASKGLRVSVVAS